MERAVTLVIALGVLGLAFGVVERLWPSVRGQRFLLRRKGAFTDMAWWLFTPTFGKLFTGIVVAVSVLALAAVLGMGLTVDRLRGVAERDTLVGRQPLALQLVEFLLLADLLAYVQHRAFHTFERLWRIHAVHHSSTEVDWLSSVRVHPLNDAIGNTIVAAPLLLLGFSPATLGAYLPFLTLYAIMLHANVGWDFGALRYVVASPAYHRWHHSSQPEAINKNFSGLFPFVDWAFGTLYFPKDRQPVSFGVAGERVPDAFLGQLTYPFRSSKHDERMAVVQTA
jgi:sterol desaturase/sphingolipid hydroxylase (fatty acid hydroxylase superfamily)